MNDFKAPPPPPSNFTAPTEEETPATMETQSSADNVNQATQEGVAAKIQARKEQLLQKFNALPGNKRQVILAAGILLIGLLLGAIIFGGSCEAPAPAPKGLQGVVSNPDIKESEHLKRCGLVDASSPCVLYVMNSYTYEKLAEDFFETAVSVTRRKDLVIRMDNVRYATMRIPPGYFAQIKIPAYK